MEAPLYRIALIKKIVSICPVLYKKEAKCYEM